jgi:hypothetical protein
MIATGRAFRKTRRKTPFLFEKNVALCEVLDCFRALIHFFNPPFFRTEPAKSRFP